MDILFLSHCVPNPPDKGEKIRSYHELNRLAAKYRVHLVCFAKSDSEMKDAWKLRDRCASVYAELLPQRRSLVRAAVRSIGGKCLMTSFYGSARMLQHVNSLTGRLPLLASLAYSSAAAQYAPPEIPLVLDMVDVDSEKWLQYGRMRWPGMLYRLEGQRLRRREIDFANRAVCTFLSTWHEAGICRSFVPNADIRCLENGVDFDYFDPSLGWQSADLRGRRFVVFVGAMNYYPNADAVCWFASHVFRHLRKRQPNLEFFIVGRDPTAAVRRLARQPGITVTGTVSDVRPYLAASEAVVAPLRVARGIQNKVLEALAMGKFVYASTAVCDTFGRDIPAGIIHCRSERDYLRNPRQVQPGPASSPAAIRSAARRRFSWNTNLNSLIDEMESLLDRQRRLELRLH